jgi:Tol biopolymer transport system component
MAEREAKPILLLQTPFRELEHVVSPDERWLAYISNESGPLEVYVRPFTPDAPAGTGAKWLVSKGGGIHPRWGADSKTLVYLHQNTSEAMTVDLDTNKGFQTGSQRSMFVAAVMALTNGWDETSDGKRFLYSIPPGTGSSIPFTVVVNWAAGLKK